MTHAPRTIIAIAAFSTLACQRSAPPDDNAVDSTAESPATPQPDTSVGSPTPPGATGSIPEPLSMPQPDTSRGIVRLVGNDPQAVLVLVAANPSATPTLSLVGQAAPFLRNVVGLEVMISGRQTSDIDLQASPRGAPKFLVDNFAVRSADGVVAHDGVLEMHDHSYSLRLADNSSVPIVNLPTALREHVGARIFLVGALGREPQAWGIIATPSGSP